MRRSDGEPFACRSIAAWDMTVLPFATQIKNTGAAIEANSPIESKVIFCVQGVISPLLANIAFHGMEQALGVKYKTRGELNGPRALVRYADDFVVFCESEADAHAAKSEISAWLAVRGLRLSEAKTRIVHLTQGFD